MRKAERSDTGTQKTNRSLGGHIEIVYSITGPSPFVPAPRVPTTSAAVRVESRMTGSPMAKARSVVPRCNPYLSESPQRGCVKGAAY